MASLDKIEGELVDAGLLVVLVALLYLAYKFRKLPTLADVLSQVQAWLNQAFNSMIPKLPQMNYGATGPRSPVDVVTGTNIGTGGAFDSVDGYTVTDATSEGEDNG